MGSSKFLGSNKAHIDLINHNSTFDTEDLNPVLHFFIFTVNYNFAQIHTDWQENHNLNEHTNRQAFAFQTRAIA